jgi:hypothetical protein
MLNLSKSCWTLASSLTIITALANLSTVVVAKDTLKQGYLKQGTPTQEDKNTVLNNQKYVKFQLNQCSRSNKSSTVICSLLATNVSERDQYFTISSERLPRAFDASGNVYRAKLLQLGDRKSPSRVSTTIIRGIPIKLLLNFEITPEVSELTILEVNHNFIGHAKAEFRNVSIAEIATNTKPNTPTRSRKK